MLVALIRSPSRYSPFKNLHRTLTQRNEVLDRMVDLKMITAGAIATRQSGSGSRLAKKPPGAQENYAMDAVRREVDYASQ